MIDSLMQQRYMLGILWKGKQVFNKLSCTYKHMYNVSYEEIGTRKVDTYRVQDIS